MAVATLGRGMLIRGGAFNLLRNLEGTVGRPWGAKEGAALGEGEDSDEASSLSFSDEDNDSSGVVMPPAKLREHVVGRRDLPVVNTSTYHEDKRRGETPRRRPRPW